MKSIYSRAQELLHPLNWFNFSFDLVQNQSRQFQFKPSKIKQLPHNFTFEQSYYLKLSRQKMITYDKDKMIPVSPKYNTCQYFHKELYVCVSLFKTTINKTFDIQKSPKNPTNQKDSPSQQSNYFIINTYKLFKIPIQINFQNLIMLLMQGDIQKFIQIQSQGFKISIIEKRK
eukprot:TRINITY_DN1309_c0_g1_i9.p1 TRINITY_DN1309_c0_g1~~TRINITY_DN1309_c0_g1_i9.p1  ORF type:complete len:199 (+),score=-16.63 TRINITY_DN1309_c0_g1_i9:80-598(+)